MNRKMITAADVRWFGNSPRLLPYLFGQEVSFKTSQDILAPPQSPLPSRPRRPWLRLLIARDPYADADYIQEAPTPSSIDEMNWVDFYGESYSFSEKKLVVSWSSFQKPSGRTELTFLPEKSHWEFYDICQEFLHHACNFDSSLSHTFERIQEFHINPHPRNPYTDGQQVLLFIGGLWLVYNRQTQLLTEKVEYAGPEKTSFPTLRPVYHEEMTFFDEFLREGALKNSTADLLPAIERKTPV